MIKPIMLALLGIAAASAALAQDADGELAKVKERELEQVRERISTLKQSMDLNARERDRLSGELQDIEVAISEQRMRLKDIAHRQRFAENRKKALDSDLAEREAHLDEESRDLAVQVRAAYMSGSQEKIKLLLSQRDPATLGRLMTYYRYLNDYRADNIAAVTGEIHKLAELRSQIAAEEVRLAELAKRRYAKLSELEGSQQQRQVLLASLRKKIVNEAQEVARLTAQEKDLSQLIAELTSILSDYPISSEAAFSKLKGKLTWPVAGKLLHDYGQPRVGGKIKWHGVVPGGTAWSRSARGLSRPDSVCRLAGRHGAARDRRSWRGLHDPVRLQRNHSTKTRATWVAPGDVIATVGDSGGQQQPGVYFELRKGAKPINPRQWVTRRPGG